jgi:spermidine/putrescine transport system substrate-binding protein
MDERCPRIQTPISRREFFLRSRSLGAAGLSLSALLTACRSDSSGAAALNEAGGNSLFFENWPVYIDPTEDGVPGTVDRFKQATGVDMRYTEAFNDNNEYFAKIQPILASGGSIEPDILPPTYWLAARLIRLGWVDKLPLDKVPNVVNLKDDLKNPTWDPTGEYTLPWQTGMAGIAYNFAATGRDLGSVDDLFDPKFKGKIGLVTELVDTIGLLLLGLGVDPSGITSFEEAAPAFEQLEKAKNSGQIRAFTGNDYLDDLSSGNFAACIGWSGDVLQLAKDNPNVRFVIPEQGGMRYADVMVMPRGARNREAAAKWMNFVYDPVEAARITAKVQFISPVKGVQEELAKIDEKLAANPLLFPDAATNARLKSFANLTDAVQQKFDAAFSRIIGA